MIAALPLSVSAAGEYVPGNPRWSGYQNQVQWGRPAGAASGDSFEYEAQLLLGDDVVESKAVEIDTYLFFTNDVVTRPQEEYTIRVRARWIMIVGDPDGQYMVADVGEAEPPHEHSYTQKHDAAQHWQACSCGEKLNVANHAYGEWRVTKPATETEEGSKARDCTVCDHVQTETIPMLEHEHGIHDETWKYDKTQHWQECSCGEKLNVANHAYGEWRVTKPATETEEGSKARDCTVCDHVQTETIPMLEHEHGIHDETWKYDKTQHWQECSCGEKLNVANHIYGDWKVTKEATETEVGSRERGCTVCEYVQVEIIPEIGHEHGIHDETWKYDETDHWQECSCGEKLNVANHTYGDWKVTKEATETEAGSRERGCAVCEYVQTEAIPAAGTGEPTDSTDPTDSSDSQGQQDPSGDTGSPQTGDGSDMALWIGLMMASCGGVLGMLFYRRKKAAAGK